MNYKKIKTRAKVNLTLDVLGKREDGYHEVEMIMQSIDLFDEMEFFIRDKEIKISCDHCEVPMNHENIVYQAAKLLQEEYEVDKGVEIKIKKNIPVAAGLAGGSTNAAGTLKALNQLWELNLSKSKLMDLGLKIGADVPFCVLGGTALSQGIGEKLKPLSPLPCTWMVLVKPPISVSTRWVYNNLKLDTKTEHPQTLKVIQGIKEGNIGQVIPYLQNILEDVTISAYPEIQYIKNKMTHLGTEGVLMSGSGPTVFALCKSEKQAQSIYNSLKEEYEEIFMVKTYNEEARRFYGQGKGLYHGSKTGYL